MADSAAELLAAFLRWVRLNSSEHIEIVDARRGEFTVTMDGGGELVDVTVEPQELEKAMQWLTEHDHFATNRSQRFGQIKIWLDEAIYPLDDPPGKISLVDQEFV